MTNCYKWEVSGTKIGDNSNCINIVPCYDHCPVWVKVPNIDFPKAFGLMHLMAIRRPTHLNPHPHPNSSLIRWIQIWEM